MDNEARFATIEATLEGVQKTLVQVQVTLAQMAEVLTAQARSNEQIKTLFRMNETQTEELKDIRNKFDDLRKTCAEWKPVIESVAGDHEATAKNSLVSKGVLNVLKMIGSAVAGAITAYHLKGGG